MQILAVNLPLVLDTSGVLLSRDHCSDLNLGSAWSFSLSGSSAKGTARRNQVNEQSGLYAEEGGYHVYADNVHLKGGVIASTNAQNSELSTNRFTFEDIQNDSHSQATSLSGSVGMSRSSDTLYDKNGKVINNPTRAQYADKSLKREKGETSLTGGVGIPLHESQSDSSLTKATLTEGKIILNKDSQPTQTTAKALGINTELKNANEQVENTLNLDRTLQEQNAVQTAVANLQEAAKTYVANKRQDAQAEFDKVKQQHDKDSEAYKTAEAAVKAWEIGGKNKQNIDTVTAVVSTVLAGSPAEQIAVAALSPTLNNQIHALTKDDNSKVTNILAHAVLGAIEAKAAGVNGASGAVAAAGAEIIAHTLAEQLYGVDGKTKTIDDLTQEEKQNILTLSQIGSAIAGGMTADSGYADGVSGEIGKRAVENNLLNKQDDELVYQLSEKLRETGSLTKSEQNLLASRLLRDRVVDNLLLIYQEDPSQLSETQKKILTEEIYHIASSYGISAEALFNTDLKNTIKRDDKDVITYLNQNDNFHNNFMYSSKEGWQTIPLFSTGIVGVGKAIQLSPRLIAAAEKYPLLTEMGVTAVVNTGYQLSQDEPYDPYSLLKSELSTVLTRNKTLGQQISINVGINTLATTNPDDYGWNALGAVTGTLGAYGTDKGVSYLIKSSLGKVIVPLSSGYAGEYFGEPKIIESEYNNLKGLKHDK